MLPVEPVMIVTEKYIDENSFCRCARLAFLVLLFSRAFSPSLSPCRSRFLFLDASHGRAQLVAKKKSVDHGRMRGETV